MQLNLWPNSLKRPIFSLIVSPLKTTVSEHIVNYTNHTPKQITKQINNVAISDVNYALLFVS